MERLTWEYKDGGMFVDGREVKNFICDDEAVCTGNAIIRLAAYEDTDLTPEEIREKITSEDYWHREALKWAGKLGEHRIKFRKLLNDFGIPECDFPDNELEQFLFSTRQQDTKEGEYE